MSNFEINRYVGYKECSIEHVQNLLTILKMAYDLNNCIFMVKNDNDELKFNSYEDFMNIKDYGVIDELILIISDSTEEFDDQTHINVTFKRNRQTWVSVDGNDFLKVKSVFDTVQKTIPTYTKINPLLFIIGFILFILLVCLAVSIAVKSVILTFIAIIVFSSLVLSNMILDSFSRYFKFYPFNNTKL